MAQIEMVNTYYDIIYLSPHLDDAVLSCGGQIFQATAVQRQSVLIVTIMAGDPVETAVSEFAQGQHQSWDLLHEATAQRRAEDMAACRLIGADHAHWQVPDCIYRHHPQTGITFYNSDPDIFGAVHPAEYPLVDDLAAQLTHLPPHGRILAPLTIGNHVDHQLTRLAAEKAFGSRLVYYEEYPYAQRLGGVDSVIAPDDPQWQAEVMPLSPEALQMKIKAIAAYPSQMANLFNGRSHMIQLVTDYTQTIGGERIWYGNYEIT
ncbi:MAG: PIG-L family deacetylase [Ardenticatenaceae bacterium]|nr:PIG-L family deacetylase [Ardenticatenaceae bacterium]